MKITGHDIQQAYRAIDAFAFDWDDLTIEAQEKYEALATALVGVLESQQVTIEAVRCEACNEMVPAAVCRWHPCFSGEAK